MKVEKIIKTQCGIEKFKNLEKKKTLLGKLRLWIFVFIAALRDFNKK